MTDMDSLGLVLLPSKQEIFYIPLAVGDSASHRRRASTVADIMEPIEQAFRALERGLELESLYFGDGLSCPQLNRLFQY